MLQMRDISLIYKIKIVEFEDKRLRYHRVNRVKEKKTVFDTEFVPVSKVGKNRSAQ